MSALILLALVALVIVAGVVGCFVCALMGGEVERE
jgi:hypothetical protein